MKQRKNNWYQQDILFLLKYYNLFGFNYCCEFLHKSARQMYYQLNKLGINTGHQALSKKQRHIIYLQKQVYNGTQIQRILNMTFSQYQCNRSNLYKKINCKDYKEVRKWKESDKNLINLLLLPSEKELINVKQIDKTGVESI